MKAIFSYAMLLLALISLAACAPDPRNQADADRTRALTEQDTLDRTQARALELQENQALAAGRGRLG